MEQLTPTIIFMSQTCPWVWPGQLYPTTSKYGRCIGFNL